MSLDLGYFGYSAPNLTVNLPHKKPRKSDLSLEQKGQNTKHSQNRVCNEHAMKGIMRLSNFSAHKTLLILCSNGKNNYQQKASQVRRKFQS